MCFCSQSLKVLNCGAVASRVTLIFWLFETIILQTSPVQRTKKILVDLEGGSEMPEDQIIYSSAWGIPSRGSVELLHPKLGHHLPARLLSFSLYLPLAVTGSISGAPLSASGTPSWLCCRAWLCSGSPPSSHCCWAATAAWAPKLQAGRNSSNPGQLPELVHAALRRQCQYNSNQQSGWLLLPGKCRL